MTEEHGLESLRLVGLVLEFSNVGRGLTVFGIYLAVAVDHRDCKYPEPLKEKLGPVQISSWDY